MRRGHEAIEGLLGGRGEGGGSGKVGSHVEGVSVGTSFQSHFIVNVHGMN